MLFLLDTSAFSDLIVSEPNTTSKMASISAPDEAVVCSIVRGEILFGIQRLRAGKRREGLRELTDKLFGIIPCTPVPTDAGDYYASLKVSTRRRGLPVDDNDLWIAATALALSATLVTRDSDFARIEGLEIADWSP